MHIGFIVYLCVVSPCVASPQLDEANGKFTYSSKPIHPFMVKEFSNDMADNRPAMTTAVDVIAGFDSNKCLRGNVEKKGDWWFAETKEVNGNINLYESFGYRWLGRLANGAHVLEVGSSRRRLWFFYGFDVC